MRIKFLSISFFIGITLLQSSFFNAHAVDATTITAFDTDAHFKSCGLSPQPLQLSIKDEFSASYMREFHEFQENQKQLHEKTSTYAIVKSFITELLKTDPMKVTIIEPWISNPVNSQNHMPSQNRILFVDFEVLAQLLTTVSSNKVSVEEIQSFIKDKKSKLQDTERFYALKAFATSVLQLPFHDVENLNTLLLSTHCPHSPTEQVLNCKFDLPFNLVRARSGRDITLDFELFERDIIEKKSRIGLHKDLSEYLMPMGSGIPMHATIPSVMETIPYGTLGGMAIPKDCDISLILTQNKMTSLNGLVGSFDDRFRAVGRFIACRQHNPTVEIPNPELFKNSLVHIDDNRLYRDGAPLTTGSAMFAFTTLGELCVQDLSKSKALGMIHHSYFFQIDDVGIPLAAAGYLEAKEGKITAINNHTGHYGTMILQIILAIAYFHEKGVVDENLTLNHFTGMSSNLSLQEILDIAKMVQLTSQ